jgi:hypothetical protein
MSTVIATPAYGRKYPSVESVRKDWNEGKDFRFAGTSTYFSVRDTEDGKPLNGREVWIDLVTQVVRVA